ncbi:MAG: endonuclease/exonuclease/phosphatase family protein [Pyrinomonadaceae bacterium]|nr:endonuclease/exonuclease/phosphatase family protein [Pyrinomonadaceae bacterium]
MCVLLLSGAGYFASAHKYLELTTHFKLQYLIGSVGCLLVFIFFGSWPWAVCMLIGCFINLSALVPFYISSSRIRTGATRANFRVLLSNVNSLSTHYQALIDLVNEETPDVLIAQEVNNLWLSELKVVGNLLPHSVTVPRERGAGIALYSRIPLQQSEVVDPERTGRPSILAQLCVDERTISLLAIHPHAPVRRDHFEYRNRLLCAASSLARRMSAPKIVIGDFNCSMWSPYFSNFVRKAGLVDARKGFGVLPTWPTQMLLKPLLMIPIDHCLVSPDIKVVSIRTGRNIGSDHLPLIVELAIPKS